MSRKTEAIIGGIVALNLLFFAVVAGGFYFWRETAGAPVRPAPNKKSAE